MFPAIRPIVARLQANRCSSNSLPLFPFAGVLSADDGFNINKMTTVDGRMGASNHRELKDLDQAPGYGMK